MLTHMLTLTHTRTRKLMLTRTCMHISFIYTLVKWVKLYTSTHAHTHIFGVYISFIYTLVKWVKLYMNTHAYTNIHAHTNTTSDTPLTSCARAAARGRVSSALRRAEHQAIRATRQLPGPVRQAANECATSPSAHDVSAATRRSRSGAGPSAHRCPAGRRRRYQSLVSLAKGVMIRSWCEPKSMTRTVSSSTPMTRPRPYVS